VGTAKPTLTKPSSNAFFSSLPTFGSTNPPPIDLSLPKLDPLKVYEANLTLVIYSASISVKLDRKMKDELHRSMKKNPPTSLKYGLIYVCGNSSLFYNLFTSNRIDHQG
jgi:hypothetical protein